MLIYKRIVQKKIITLSLLGAEKIVFPSISDIRIYKIWGITVLFYSILRILEVYEGQTIYYIYPYTSKELELNF